MENKIQRLRDHQYSSRMLSDSEVESVALADFRCERCGESVFELSDFPETDNIEDFNCLCEECYSDEYESICDVCEEIYERREDKKMYLVISETNDDEADKIGIYEVLQFPYFISNHFFASLYEENIKLVRECRIESMLNNIYNKQHKILYADNICQDCAEKFALLKPLSKSIQGYSLHKRINIRGIIERGF